MWGHYTGNQVHVQVMIDHKNQICLHKQRSKEHAPSLWRNDSHACSATYADAGSTRTRYKHRTFFPSCSFFMVTFNLVSNYPTLRQVQPRHADSQPSIAWIRFMHQPNNCCPGKVKSFSSRLELTRPHRHLWYDWLLWIHYQDLLQASSNHCLFG